jgi:hypothetical protein
LRVPPPGILKLDRRALLRDVRERLSERMPAYGETSPDPTDPGWLLLEQSAWMAEIVSGQLDQYPFSVVQHFVRMMGGHLLPAHPSLGVVVVEASKPGVMVQRPDRPSPWRFFTAQTETTDLVEFVPVEQEVPIRKGWLDSMCIIADGELRLTHHRGKTDGLEAHVGWQDADQRSGIFDDERLRFVLVTSNTKKLIGTLEKAIAKVAERNIGWLQLSVGEQAKGQVVVDAVVDPAAAFISTIPEEADGLWEGGDLQALWGSLDDTNWTPPVEVAEHPLLPARIRGATPLPGMDEGTLLVPGVPQAFPVDQLLVRGAAPMPDTVVEAIWKTLTHQDKSLVPFKPTVRREYAAGGGHGEPAWVLQALESGVWGQIAERSPSSVAHIQLLPRSRGEGKVRVGLALEQANADMLGAIRIFGEHQEGHVPAEELPHEVVWRLTTPPRFPGQGMGLVAAVDVTVEASHAGLVIAYEGELAGAMLNPVLVANMPAVRDGREVRVRRNVPEGVSLLFQDLVTPEVIEQLAGEPIPDDALGLVKKLQLSSFSLKEGEDITDWHGVDVDPSEGRMTLNAPDRNGNLQQLPPGERVKLSWYRRTDGARADVPAGAVRLVEEEAGVKPSLVGVHNPLGTFFGAAREAPEAAVDRLFAPAGGTPVLPADFERVVRQALGTRGRGWVVRCWTYSERSLVSTALWPQPLGEAPANGETARLERALESAGPDCLLVVVGPPDEVLGDEDLDWARRAIQQRIKRFGERLPVVRRAEVSRFWPLRLRGGEGARDLLMPCFDLARCEGELVDRNGTTAPPPRAAMFLNAAVVEVEVLEGAE